jgi:hypothetical protein
MIKVFEIILCMYLKTISPDVPRFTILKLLYYFFKHWKKVGYNYFIILQYYYLNIKISTNFMKTNSF